MDKILTIIIPTYNMEKYLRHCLDSLIVPNMDKVEVLVINDGSKDSSSAIAHEYQDKYPQTFRIIDKENGNYGSCVNRGLKEALGKYVKVLDADDYFDSKVFENYLNYLTDTDVDLILTDYNEIGVDGTITRKHTISYHDKKPLKVDEHCTDIAFARLEMHAITYRRENLLEHQYSQTTGVSYTDQEWVFLPLTYMDTFIHFKGALYQYLVGREGQTVDPSVASKQAGVRFNLIYKRLNIYESIKNNNICNKNKLMYLRHRLFRSCSNMYKQGIVVKCLAKGLIEDFDNQVKGISSELYDAIPHSIYCTYKGLPYIGYWRKHYKVPFYVRLVSKIS